MFKILRHTSQWTRSVPTLMESIQSPFNFSPLILQQQQTRWMSRVKERVTHPRYVWPKKKRERNDQELTADNQEFINQVIHDRYGPVAIPETGEPYVSPLKHRLNPRGEWRPGLMRPGLIGRKIGIYPMWDKNGNRMNTAMIQIVDNHVIKYLSPEVCMQNYPRNKWKGRGILICGAESTDPQLFTKEYCNLFNEAGVLPKMKISRFVVNPEAALEPGTPLYVNHFRVGQYVDVQGKTVDRHFQGVMKRWGFKGMPTDRHGVTKSHRRGGCIGSGRERARVIAGQKMPGHDGAQMRIIRAQKIVRINTKYNIIYLKGSGIQGETGNFLVLRDTFIPTRFYNRENAPPFPTFYPEDTDGSLPEDIYDETMFNFASPSITFEDDEKDKQKAKR